jgi:hypothetical protein
MTALSGSMALRAAANPPVSQYPETTMLFIYATIDIHAES